MSWSKPEIDVESVAELSDFIDPKDPDFHEKPPFEPSAGFSGHIVYNPKEIDPKAVARYNIPVDLLRTKNNWQTRAATLRPFALRMFLDRHSVKAITEMLGLGYDTVIQWKLGEDWEGKRNELENKFYDAVMRSRLKTFAAMSTDAVDVIAKVIKKYRTGEKEATLRDAEAISRIFSNMDKLVRLSGGMPTDITEHRDTTKLVLPKTAVDIQRILDMDPFIDITPKKDE